MNIKNTLDLFKKYNIWLYATPLIIYFLILISRINDFTLHDFGNYYFGSILYKLDLFSNEIYAPCHFNTLVRNLGYESYVGTYYPFTPITSLIFYPLTYFEPIVAKIILNTFSFALFLVSLIRTVNFLKLPKYLLLIIPIIFLIPIKNNILFGQIYFLLFVLITESYILYAKDKKWLSSLLLAIAIIIKIFPVILIFFFLTKKDYKQVLRVIFFGVLLFIISLIFNGFDIWNFYIFQIFIPALDGKTGLDFILNHQSSYIYFKYLFVKDAYLNTSPLINNYNLFIISNILFKSLLITIGFFLKKMINNERIEFGIWILISLLISPNGSTYSLILLIIPLLYLISNQFALTRKNLTLILLITVICNIPMRIISTENHLLQFPRLLFFLILFSIVLFWNVKKIQISRFLLFFILIISLQLLKPNNQNNSAGETVYGGRSLICGLNINDNILSVNEFHIEGITTKKINIFPSNKSFDSKDLVFKDKQLFFKNKLIYNSSNNILNPIIYGNKAYFLTDENQGYKFYKLKSIQLE